MTNVIDTNEIIRVETIQPNELITDKTKLKNWIPVINNVIDNQTTTSSMGNVFFIEKNVNTSFDEAFSEYVQNSTTSFKLTKNDVVIVRDIDGDGNPLDQSAYVYNGDKWIACTGFVDASKVVMYSDITMAGNYTSVGNKTKDINNTSTFLTKGMSVQDILQEIFTKREQPQIVQPSLSDFTIDQELSLEAGTQLNDISYSDLKLNVGQYQYGPNPNGVALASYTLTRITNSNEEIILSSADLNENVDSDLNITVFNAGSEHNDEVPLTIGDSGGENTFSSLYYKATVQYTNGDVALDNMGDSSKPVAKILADTLEAKTEKFSCYRNYFYGASEEKSEFTSDYIRSLDYSEKEYKSGDFIKLFVPEGTKRIVFACPSKYEGPESIINIDALNADMIDNFSQYNTATKSFAGHKAVCAVSGANNYSPISYKIWYYEPALPYKTTARLIIKLK